MINGILTLTGMSGETINGKNFGERCEFFRSHRKDPGASDGEVKRHTSPQAQFFTVHACRIALFIDLILLGSR